MSRLGLFFCAPYAVFIAACLGIVSMGQVDYQSQFMYLELPIADGSAINADNAARLQQLLQYADGPVLLHCGSANRAGGLLALMAALNEGQAHAAALEFGRKAGMKSTEAAVQAALATHCNQAEQRC